LGEMEIDHLDVFHLAKGKLAQVLDPLGDPILLVKDLGDLDRYLLRCRGERLSDCRGRQRHRHGSGSC